MSVNMCAISISVNIPICTSVEDIQEKSGQDADLEELKSCVIQGWPYMHTCKTKHESLLAN